jgi:LacI family transcriptional regulator
MTDRLNGYIKTVKDNRLDKYVLKIPFGTENSAAVAKIKSFLKKNAGLDAVLFATNYLAISGLEAIDELGLSIPGDIGVIGFDDNTHFGLFSPSITAIAQPVQMISEEVVRKMMMCLSGKEKEMPKETTVLPVRLIERDSAVTVERRALRS